MPKRRSKTPVENSLELDPAISEEITGSKDSSFAARLLNQVLDSNSTQKGSSTEWDALLANSAFEMLRGIKPSDAIEGMLAAQMVATHNAALECFDRAMRPNQPIPAREYNLKNAAKLSALFARQIETLDKHRGKGQQKVTVEHVHVASGGQAIVGTVETGSASRATAVKESKEINSIAHTKEKNITPKTRERKKAKQPRIRS